MSELGELYLAVWKRMFKDVLGWSGQETLVWANRYEKFLQDPDDMIDHADPPYWAWPAFVPKTLNQKLSPDQRSRLMSELLSTLPAKLHLASYLDVNWKLYKSKINSIVEQYAAL